MQSVEKFTYLTLFIHTQLVKCVINLIDGIDIRNVTYYNDRKEAHMPLTPKQMIKLLKANGFVIINQNGSHVKLRNQTTGRQTEVPMHCKDLKKGLENAILKQAGLKQA